VRKGSYVAPDRRGQGLGRALMEAAIELARRMGADHMDLGTSEDDMPLVPSTRASGSSTEKAVPTARSTTSTSASCDGGKDTDR
jgi:GNAT superfamily N-acetyltransferase